MKNRYIHTWLLSSLIILGSLLILFICILVSRGEITNQIFFLDTLDTGMDFFNSIASVKDGTPYSYAATIYPPLANLIFYIIYLCVPPSYSSQWRHGIAGFVSSRGTDLDLRAHQTTLFAFILFVAITSILVYAFCKKILKEQKYAGIVAISCVLSFGYLNALERGNIISLSLLFLLIFFALYYTPSQNGRSKEFACICLAISAGIKIYPAVFGMLLIYDKDYKRAFRTILYGIAFLLLPFFLFEGSSVIGNFFNSIFGIGASSGTANVSLGGSGLKNACNTIIYAFSELFPGDFQAWLQHTDILFKLLQSGIFVCCLWFSYFVKTKWECVLGITLVLFLILEPTGYALVFAIPAFLLFILDNQIFEEMSIWNKLIFTTLLLLLVPFPVWEKLTLGEYSLPLRELLNQICILILYTYVVVKIVRILVSSWKERVVKLSIYSIGLILIFVLVKSTLLLPVAVLEKYSLPQNSITNSKSIEYAIETSENTDDKLYVAGWCILKGDAQHYNTFLPKQLLLYDKNIKEYFVFPTYLQMRHDITDNINDGTNYDYSGFTASLQPELLTTGHTYQLCILYQTDNTAYLIRTSYEYIAEQ